MLRSAKCTNGLKIFFFKETHEVLVPGGSISSENEGIENKIHSMQVVIELKIAELYRKLRDRTLSR